MTRDVETHQKCHPELVSGSIPIPAEEANF